MGGGDDRGWGAAPLRFLGGRQELCPKGAKPGESLAEVGDGGMGGGAGLGAAGNQTLESDQPGVQTWLCVTVAKPHSDQTRTWFHSLQVLVEWVPKVI